jgi:hypothetical protein
LAEVPTNSTAGAAALDDSDRFALLPVHDVRGEHRVFRALFEAKAVFRAAPNVGIAR